jgi:NAD(P)-dependent dehydrogenase (short-subunit alcohol dehydrogenase family)
MAHDERSAIVTGASRGIGAAVAQQLADQGWIVHCLSRSGTMPALSGGKPRSVPGEHDRLLAVQIDVTDRAAVEHFFRSTQLRDPALLVNCAGIHVEQDALTLTDSDLELVMRLNLTAPIHLSQEFARVVGAEGGVIANIGSFFEQVGVAGSLAYSASKAALASATRTMAVEWARRKIWVINVAPGYVETDINKEYLNDPAVRRSMASRIPRGGPASAEDVAVLISVLAAPVVASQLTGQTIYPDGGQRIRL